MICISGRATNRHLKGKMKRKKSKSKRRHKRQLIKSEEDRLSLLPDCLLVDIITRLPDTKEAFRTGTLSKRWQHLWPQVPNLIYAYHVEDDGFYSDRIAKFLSFVEKTLTQRGQSNINKFKLHCSNYSIETESQLNNCICYAISNNVKEFDIKVWDYLYLYKVVLPQCFFTSSSFVHLRWSEHYMRNSEIGVISWKNLRTLRLKRAILKDDLFQNILSGSPLLETLELADWLGLLRLDISNKSVKNLVLSFGNMSPCFWFLEVNAPYILSLTIQKCAPLLEKLLLLNVSSVIEVELNYSNNGNPYLQDREPFEETLRGLLLSLGHVKEIKIGKLCLEALALLKAKGFMFPSNLKIVEDIDSNSSGDWKRLLLDHGPKGEEVS